MEKQPLQSAEKDHNAERPARSKVGKLKLALALTGALMGANGAQAESALTDLLQKMPTVEGLYAADTERFIEYTNHFNQLAEAIARDDENSLNAYIDAVEELHEFLLDSQVAGVERFKVDTSEGEEAFAESWSAAETGRAVVMAAIEQYDAAHPIVEEAEENTVELTPDQQEHFEKTRKSIEEADALLL
jgi:hypothetical protein